MMARARIGEKLALGRAASAVLPFLCAQFVVLAATVALPQLTESVAGGEGAASPPPLSDEEVRRRLDSIPIIVDPVK
jgi:hypothetical protein